MTAEDRFTQLKQESVCRKQIFCIFIISTDGFIASHLISCVILDFAVHILVYYKAESLIIHSVFVTKKEEENWYDSEKN